MRIRTKRHEIMISPGMILKIVFVTAPAHRPFPSDDRYLLAVLHDPAS